MVQEVDFDLYTFSKLPTTICANKSYLLCHDTGEVFMALVGFQTSNKQTYEQETALYIQALPEFPNPFPLWASEPVEPEGPAVTLEKVDFLPAPGIMVITHQGYIFHWIKNNVLYMLVAENVPSYQEVLEFVGSLTKLG